MVSHTNDENSIFIEIFSGNFGVLLQNFMDYVLFSLFSSSLKSDMAYKKQNRNRISAYIPLSLFKTLQEIKKDTGINLTRFITQALLHEIKRLRDQDYNQLVNTLNDIRVNDVR